MTTRRGFCLAVGEAALLANFARTGYAQGADSRAPYSSGVQPPKLEAPPNACDCHMHIYDSRFPAAANATLKPPSATVEDYRLLQKRLGTTRVVVVTPSTYGTDNRCMVDAVATLGATARGIAVVDTAVTDAVLRELAGAGVRGIRFNLTVGAVTTIEMVEPLARRIHDLGWHVQVNIAPDALVNNQDMLRRLPTPVVFDHMARIPLTGDVEQQAAFVAVNRLIDRGNAWVKLSGAYLGSKGGPPAYADTNPLGRAYAKIAPERIVWGSDWPHPTIDRDKPDDAMLFDLLAEWAPSEAARRRILVTNPEVLYGFPPTT